MKSEDGFEDIGIEFGAALADGAYWPMHLTGRELIRLLFRDDVRPAIRRLTIKAKTTDGKTVRVTFANDDSLTVDAEVE
jgi:hypothetical protein